MTDRPNILLIQADQLAAPFLSCYGNSVSKTPHIDQLAGNGVMFENAYCNFPLCGPSRFSMMTGRLASRVGAFDNGSEFPASIPTLAHYLRHAGYRSAISGKMHFVGADQLHGFEERLTPEIYSTGFDLTADWSTGTSGLKPDPRLLTDIGVAKRTAQMDYDEEVGYRAVGKLFDWARSNDERPFFLTASFTHPHDPYVTTAKYWNRYREDEIDLPQMRLRAEDQDPHSRRCRHIYGVDLVNPDDDHLRRLRHSYYANVSYIDDKIGALLKTLDDCGFGDNTVVIFTSDHGEMLGERDLFQKKNFFEHANRIPLIFHCPALLQQGRRISSLTSLVDLLPTLLDLADADPAYATVAPLDGKSLYPQLVEESLVNAASEDCVYGEILSETTLAPLLMIRRDRWKYIWSLIDPPMLFDLVADPMETRNLAGSEQVAEIETAFANEVRNNWDVESLNETVILSQRRRRFILGALNQGQRVDWNSSLPPTGQSAYCTDDLSYYDWTAAGSL